MSSSKIPEEVKQFINDHINSVEQLEILLLLSSTPEQEWSAREVSQKLYTQPESATTRLSDLCARGIVTVRQATEPLYRFNPAASSIEPMVRALRHAYQVYKDSVITQIYSKPSSNIQAFSNAFRIRRDH